MIQKTLNMETNNYIHMDKDFFSDIDQIINHLNIIISSHYGYVSDNVNIIIKKLEETKKQGYSLHTDIENPKKRLEKYRVCDQCLSIGIIYNDCVCAYDKYKTIELEFEVCSCCNKVIDDGQPAETEFNKKQLKTLNKE